MNMEDRKSRVDVEFYVGLFENVLRDAYASFPEIPSREFERDMSYVRRRVQCEGLPFLTVHLPSLGKALDASLETGELTVPNAFGCKSKGGVRWNIPKLFSALFLLTFTTEGALRPGEKRGVGAIRHLCFLCYKVQVPHTESQVLKACSKYKAVDGGLPVLTKELTDRMAFKYARLLLRRLLGEFNPNLITPCHGPGAVAERFHARAKYDFSYYSPEIDQLYPYVKFMTFGVLAQTPDSLTKHLSLKRESIPSRVCMVPKDSRGPRTIAAEPALLQYLQQGLGRALVDWVEHHPLTRGRVLFTDQTKHRSLALHSSINRQFATLDLQDASDRVSLDLVEKLFPEHLLKGLKALRSPRAVLPDGSVVDLKKYASMGSALCFPVEALTFWALASGALWDVRRKALMKRQPVYVYGDDIIVPTEHAQAVIAELELYGVQFSPGKCYIKGHFRESCGMDAFLGENVTPIRLKTLVPAIPSRRRAGLNSLNEAANAFFDHGYWWAARYLDDYVEKWWGPIPTTIRRFTGLSRRSSVLPLSTHVPDGVVWRWNRTLQRREVRTLKLKARVQRSPFPDWASRLGHNLIQTVPRPYSEEVAVPHSALSKAVWESIC